MNGFRSPRRAGPLTPRANPGLRRWRYQTLGPKTSRGEARGPLQPLRPEALRYGRRGQAAVEDPIQTYYERTLGFQTVCHISGNYYAVGNTTSLSGTDINIFEIASPTTTPVLTTTTSGGFQGATPPFFMASDGSSLIVFGGSAVDAHDVSSPGSPSFIASGLAADFPGHGFFRPDYGTGRVGRMRLGPVLTVQVFTGASWGGGSFSTTASGSAQRFTDLTDSLLVGFDLPGSTSWTASAWDWPPPTALPSHTADTALTAPCDVDEIPSVTRVSDTKVAVVVYDSGANESWVVLVDFSSPSSPSILGSLQLGASVGDPGPGEMINDTELWVSGGSAGISRVDVSGSTPTLIKQLDFADLSAVTPDPNLEPPGRVNTGLSLEARRPWFVDYAADTNYVVMPVMQSGSRSGSLMVLSKAGIQAL